MKKHVIYDSKIKITLLILINLTFIIFGICMGNVWLCLFFGLFLFIAVYPLFNKKRFVYAGTEAHRLYLEAEEERIRHVDEPTLIFDKAERTDEQIMEKYYK